MMDSIKPSNGYGQLELEQHQTDNHTHQPPPPRRRPLILLGLAALLLLILLIVIIASTSHHHHHHIIIPAEALSIVCNVTDHPDTCISSITQLESISGNTTSNPNLILALSLQATLNSLENVMSTIRADLLSNNNETEAAELESCDTSFDDLIHNLNFSISVIERISEGSNGTLSGVELGYVGKLLGDVAAKQEECLGNVERNVTGDAVEVIRDAMGNCSVMVGNSLAIVTNFSSVLERVSGNVNAVGGNGRRLLVIGGRSGGPGGLVSGGGAVVDAGGRWMGLKFGKKQYMTLVLC